MTFVQSRRASRPLPLGLVLLSLVALFSGVALDAACVRMRTAPSKAARVVSLSPSTTEAMYAIGAEAALVGRSRYCDYPPQVLALPQVGGFIDPSFEAILGLRPDLVVGGRGPAGQKIADTIGQHGVATFFPATDTFVDIDTMILDLGARTGHEDGARTAIAKVHARIDAVETAVKDKPAPRVLLVFGLEPISVAGPKSFPDEMLRRAGARNVVTEGGSYPIVGIERILAMDPDIVLNGAMAEAHGHERITTDAPGWKELRAVKAGRVVALTDESVLRPGPRIGDGLAIIARAVHADIQLP
jgi:iron complex transport system substrate-binding protein